jgi:ATP-binding cassette subfamily F protein uup
LGLDGSGKVDIVAGGYADWEKQRRQPNAAPKKAAPKAEAAPPPPPKAAKLSYKDQRDFDLLPKRIEELETAITRDEAALADPDLYAKNPTRFAALMAA